MSEMERVKLDLSALTISTEVIESSLLAYGIQVVRVEVGGHSVYPTGPMNWFDLYVPVAQLAEAEQLLEKLAKSEAELPTAAQPDLDETDSSESQG